MQSPAAASSPPITRSIAIGSSTTSNADSSIATSKASSVKRCSPTCRVSAGRSSRAATFSPSISIANCSTERPTPTSCEAACGRSSCSTRPCCRPARDFRSRKDSSICCARTWAASRSGAPLRHRRRCRRTSAPSRSTTTPARAAPLSCRVLSRASTQSEDAAERSTLKIRSATSIVRDVPMCTSSTAALSTIWACALRSTLRWSRAGSSSWPMRSAIAISRMWYSFRSTSRPIPTMRSTGAPTRRTSGRR